jgi:hypothetical protein
MGFLEYSWAVSFQKDETKTRIRVDPELQQPTLTSGANGFNVNLPLPSASQEGTISFLGCEFSPDSIGKAKVGRLFRACVSHLTAHTLTLVNTERGFTKYSRRSHAENFAESLVDDLYVNAYILTHDPDRFADIAFANSLAFAKIKPVERIFNPAARIMAALLSQVNTGIVKGVLSSEEAATVSQLTEILTLLKEKIVSSLSGKEPKIVDEIDETTADLVEILENNGPALESPTLPYTEQIGSCSLYCQRNMLSEAEFEKVFMKSLETLTGTSPPQKTMESYWKKEVNAGACQAFDSWFHQKQKEQKILARLQDCVKATRLKSVGFPEEDYTEYLRTRILVSGGSRRLLDSLRIAQDSLDEDPGKEMGQLDLASVIQVIASRKPATDVFKLEEYLSRSFAWTILFDASMSMKIREEYARALAICIAEATKELLMDHGSWTFFAFNDRFHILKDASEPYSRKVRERIGGLKFGGLTYMPDAIQVAGDILAKRFDEQRFLIVISDGWPYGYPNIRKKLSKTINALQKRGIIVIGVGVETDKMKDFFKLNSPIYDQKDLIKKFTKIYLSASANALET